MTLLEAMVAMAILAGAGTSLVAALDAGVRSEHQARLRETSLLSADRVLAALTLLGRTDLDRRLGRHPVGEFVVDVQRPDRALYRIAVAEARAPEVEMLVTVVYRPEEVAP
jgi:type II secretory pathway component PulJ